MSVICPFPDTHRKDSPSLQFTKFVRSLVFNHQLASYGFV